MDAPAERLQLLADAVRLDARLSAWRAALAAQVERGEIAVAEHGTSTVTWLVDALRLTRRAAGRLVIEGERLARFPVVAAAAGRGEVVPEQVQVTCFSSNVAFSVFDQSTPCGFGRWL